VFHQWPKLVRFSIFATLFWLAEFAVQYWWLTNGNLASALLRSYALAGASLIGLALFSSALFKWVPRLAVHWHTRRRLGVAGVILISFHILWAYVTIFHSQLTLAYFSFNPLENPVIFGSFAYLILLIMAITSNEWMVRKLTPKVWKRVHRFVYLAYWAAIFHFLTMNSRLLKNPAGILLLLITAAALFGELFWYVRLAWKKRFRSQGAWVGLAIIILYIVTGIIVYRYRHP